MLGCSTSAPSATGQLGRCVSTHIRSAPRHFTSIVCFATAHQQPSSWGLGRTFGPGAPQSLNASSQAASRDDRIHAMGKGATGGSMKPSLQAPIRSPSAGQAGVFDAEYEHQLRKLSELLTPEAIAELTSSLPPSELQNLQRVLADMRQLGDVQGAAMHDETQPAASMPAASAPMPSADAPMHSHTDAGLSTSAQPSRSEVPVFRKPAAGMPLAARLAAREDPARQTAARLGLPYDFYSFMKAQVFKGASDDEMSTILDTMGLEHLQQLASVYQEMVELQSQPINAITDKYSELSQRMEALMLDALGGNATASHNDMSGNPSASPGTLAPPRPKPRHSSSKPQSSRKPRTSQTAPLDSQPSHSATATPSEPPVTTKRPWGSSLSQRKRTAAAPDAAASAAPLQAWSEPQAPQQAPQAASPMQQAPPQPAQQPADDEWVVPHSVDAPSRKAAQQSASERRLLSGAAGPVQAGAAARASPGRQRGALFQRAANPPSEAF